MITDEIRAVTKERAATHSEWDYGLEKCRNKEVEILTRNISDTILFLRNDCTADEFIWLSEVFDEVAKITDSIEFIESLYFVAQKYPEETGKYYILNCIKYAEGELSDETWQRLESLKHEDGTI